mmetsp:Transcript_21/g.39  ORF Transcript_21/g.39 Transcript_21/m.39 type:complete len:187 (-) Transcript_21:213-773(-)
MSASGADATRAIMEQMASLQVAKLLDRLQSLPGVTGVNPKPLEPATKPNHFGVAFKLRLPGQGRQGRRSSVTEADGDRPNFAHAVQAGIDWALAQLTEHGVEIDVDQRDDAQQPPTAEELEWLAEWIDDQPAPESVTVAQADAALAARRSSQAGSSQAGSSQAGSSQSSTVAASHDCRRCNCNVHS